MVDITTQIDNAKCSMMKQTGINPNILDISFGFYFQFMLENGIQNLIDEYDGMKVNVFWNIKPSFRLRNVNG